MYKKIISLSALALLFAVTTNAQSKAKTEKPATEVKKETKVLKPFSADEETASRKRIENFEAKITANKDNSKVDYTAEMKRLAKMKADFNKRAKTKMD